MYQSYEIATNPADGPPRLALLRTAMADAGVDAFFVPRSDAHRGENVAPCDERLAWLTGFTGSAGFAIATADTAAVYADGRYTLQVRDEIADVFETRNIPKDKAATYLKETLANDAVVGFDPWLHTSKAIKSLRKTLSDTQITIIPVPNLIDTIWDDRPPAPLGPIEPYPLEFAGETHQAKRKRLGEALAKADVAAAILTLPDSIAWLLNVRGSDIEHVPVPLVFAILHSTGDVDLFSEPQKITDTLRDHLGAGVRIHDKTAFLDHIAQLSGKIRVDMASAPIAVADALGEAEILDHRDPCVLPKAQKNGTELDGMRAAHLRDGAAMADFLCWLDANGQSGIKEIDVAKALEGYRAQTNALRDISFNTISGSGPNGAIVHYRVNEATNRALEPNSLMLVDSGGQYLDGTTDITRTIAIDTPPEDAIKTFTLVLKGMIGLSKLRWPEGLAGRDIDTMARASLWEHGFDYDHGTGHGVGAYLCVHEGPASISRRSHEPIKPGMILSNEPGYYREGAFGIRIENLVVAHAPSEIEGGDRPMMAFETLTFTPIDRRLIDVDLLTGAELDWLNAYHAQTRDAIGPRVSGATKDWLFAATQPLGPKP